MTPTEALHTLMYRQNTDAHFRNIRDVRLPMGWKAHQDNLFVNDSTMTGGRLPAQGIARPCADPAGLTMEDNIPFASRLKLHAPTLST